MLTVDAVIKINEDVFTRLFDNGTEDHAIAVTDLSAIIKSIRNCIPLPKGHGRLVDISKIDEDMMERDNPIIYLTMNGQYIEAVSLEYLNDLPTIIEADKEDENDVY